MPRLQSPLFTAQVVAFASAVLVFVLSLTSVLAVAPSPAVGELPPGPGKDTLVRVCSDCHGVDLVEGQRRSLSQWKALVDDMVARGANSSDEDTKAIITYLATALGRVNVNKAEVADIQTVLELSADESAAIVSYRTTAGEFKSVDDLRKVPGLDFSKIDGKRERITFAGQ